jgi:hypothetical protein
VGVAELIGAASLVISQEALDVLQKRAEEKPRVTSDKRRATGTKTTDEEDEG